ncbi:MAG: protein kinase [Actinobacteria bacterium]|nr:protein kinase [Actinomycetota bacterium]
MDFGDKYVGAVPVGHGAAGTVYRARSVAFGRDVAVKVFHGTLDDERLRRAFRRECEVLGALGGHPNIVPVHDSGLTASGQPWIVMGYVDLGSLPTGSPLPPGEAVAVALAVAEGLRAAHDRGVLHRDVKPQNVLRSSTGAVALADFGISVRSADEVTSAASTPTYAAPEVLRDHTAASPASDVFSLAATLYALLAGHPPQPRRPGEPDLVHLQRLVGEPAPPLPDGVPPHLARAVYTSLEPDPVLRTRTVQAFADAVRAAAAADGLTLALPAGPIASGAAPAGTTGAPPLAPPVLAPPVVPEPPRPPVPDLPVFAEPTRTSVPAVAAPVTPVASRRRGLVVAAAAAAAVLAVVVGVVLGRPGGDAVVTAPGASPVGVTASGTAPATTPGPSSQAGTPLPSSGPSSGPSRSASKRPTATGTTAPRKRIEVAAPEPTLSRAGRTVDVTVTVRVDAPATFTMLRLIVKDSAGNSVGAIESKDGARVTSSVTLAGSKTIQKPGRYYALVRYLVPGGPMVDGPTNGFTIRPFDANGVWTDEPRVAVGGDGTVTLNGRVEVTRTLHFQELQIAVRGAGDTQVDADGNPLDVAFHHDNTTVSVDKYFQGRRRYAPGTYLANVAYMLADGTWHNGPRVSFTVP